MRITVLDKLETSRNLTRAGVAQPWTLHRENLDALREIEPPFVLKPRFGSGEALSDLIVELV